MYYIKFSSDSQEVEHGSPRIDEEDTETGSVCPPSTASTSSLSPLSAPPTMNLENEAIKVEKKKEKGDSVSHTVMANGVVYSLDLLAMICYSRLKQKYRGTILCALV